MYQPGGLLPRPERPAVLERFADDLVTIASIPYKIVEGGCRPSSKDWRNTA
jgi:hypothetical protein